MQQRIVRGAHPVEQASAQVGFYVGQVGAARQVGPLPRVGGQVVQLHVIADASQLGDQGGVDRAELYVGRHVHRGAHLEVDDVLVGGGADRAHWLVIGVEGLLREHFRARGGGLAAQ